MANKTASIRSLPLHTNSFAVKWTKEEKNTRCKLSSKGGKESMLALHCTPNPDTLLQAMKTTFNEPKDEKQFNWGGLLLYALYPKEKDGLKIGLGFDATLIITI